MLSRLFKVGLGVVVGIVAFLVAATAASTVFSIVYSLPLVGNFLSWIAPPEFYFNLTTDIFSVAAATIAANEIDKTAFVIVSVLVALFLISAIINNSAAFGFICAPNIAHIFTLVGLYFIFKEEHK